MSKYNHLPKGETLEKKVRILGSVETINSQSIRVLGVDNAGDVFRCSGTVTVTDAGSGYSKGCLYTKTDAATGVSGTYINVGTNTSCTFVKLSAASEDPAFTGDITLGNAIADTVILNARIATGSIAGAALDIPATYLRNEANEFKYNVSSWTGIPNDFDSLYQFKAAYYRAESNADNANGLLLGLEGWAVANAVGVSQLEGLRGWAYAKGDSTDTIVKAYGLRGEFSMDAGRSLTLTITTEVAGVYSNITSGKVDDYTKIHGFISRMGDMDGGSRKYGSVVRALEGVEAGTSSLSNYLYTDMAADYFYVVSAADKGAVDDTIAGQVVGTINATVKCKFGATDFFLYGYATAPSL